MAFIRLKRLISHEPPEELVVHYKRQKVDDSTSSSETCQSDQKIFKLIGTVGHKNEESLHEIVKTITNRRTNPKTHIFDGVQKAKSKVKAKSKGNRYKLVNTLRGLPTEAIEKISQSFEETPFDKFDLYDAEDDDGVSKTDTVSEAMSECITCNDVPMNAAPTAGFVYDVYFIDGVPSADISWGQPVSIEGFSYLDVVVENGDTDDEDKFDDEDDSNSESNWRNDYPDEESDGEHYEDDDFGVCIKKMASCLIDRTPSCSSEDDVAPDSDDERNFGRAYATYKAKILTEDSD